MNISTIISVLFSLAFATTFLFIIKNWIGHVFTEFESVKIKINGNFIDIINLQGVLIAYIDNINGKSYKINGLSIIEASEIKYIENKHKQIYEFYKNK